MPFTYCQKCINNGNKCSFVMDYAIQTIKDLEYLINYSQANTAKSICKIDIKYECKNYKKKVKDCSTCVWNEYNENLNYDDYPCPGHDDEEE